jgi:hypothetical protein
MLPSSFNIFAECWFGTVNLSGAKGERIQGQQWEGKCLSNLDKVVFNDTCHLQAR